MTDDKPFSPACERNRDPILAVLREHFAEARHVLEVGSGTGQHAVHFAAAMPWLAWQCSDRAEHLPGIRTWLDEAALANTPPPLQLDVDQWSSLPRSGEPATLPGPATLEAIARRDPFDAVFSANTLHIMGWPQVRAFFAGVGVLLPRGGTLAVYGPFNYGGDYTSDSNREFDRWLRARDPASGIRDFEAVDALARDAGLALQADIAMPANNRCVVWRTLR
ncbi:methylase [Lysobacter arseniciresistens ZS79]|uniref:Methylase n=1 Tax=Lysobacter arseniciresistens ZS79 TaxID=913325 RepID=A0A0A0EUU7_9GAMM|nr:DUF938 domain-containing protein [Lysobacter arseniciresistens]KGM54030.1 methylase [Lysobacter arseniciresistens ZS79]